MYFDTQLFSTNKALQNSHTYTKPTGCNTNFRHTVKKKELFTFPLSYHYSVLFDCTKEPLLRTSTTSDRIYELQIIPFLPPKPASRLRPPSCGEKLLSRSRWHLPLYSGLCAFPGASCLLRPSRVCPSIRQKAARSTRTLHPAAQSSQSSRRPPFCDTSALPTPSSSIPASSSHCFRYFRTPSP